MKNRDSDEQIIDVQVGIRLKKLRETRGFSHRQLADACKLSFQQIRKYESGANRISASRLYQFAQLFSVSTIYFFEDIKPSNNWRSYQIKGKIINNDNPFF